MIETLMFIFGLACGVTLLYFYQFARDNYKVLKKMEKVDPMPEPVNIGTKFEPCKDCGVYHSIGFCQQTQLMDKPKI